MNEPDQTSPNQDRRAAMRARIQGLSGLPLLKEVMACLRDPNGGCPWDLEQDFKSITRYTIEEAYEVADAIEREDFDDLKGELGDLVLQAVYYAQMADEQRLFDLEQVLQAVADKMIARHPHVFGDGSAKSAADVNVSWEAIKAQELKSTKRRDGSVLADVGLALPALMRAQKMQKRAASVGFDWPETAQVEDKIAEELAEFADARATGDKQHMLDEFGDLLFTVVNLGRHLGLNAEQALRMTNEKFDKRFRFVETSLGDLSQHDLEAMEAAWQKAKTQAS